MRVLVIPNGCEVISYTCSLSCVCCTFGFVVYIDTVSLFYSVKAVEWSLLIKPYRVVGEEHQQRSNNMRVLVIPNRCEESLILL